MLKNSELKKVDGNSIMQQAINDKANIFVFDFYKKTEEGNLDDAFNQLYMNENKTAKKKKKKKKKKKQKQKNDLSTGDAESSEEEDADEENILVNESLLHSKEIIVASLPSSLSPSDQSAVINKSRQQEYLPSSKITSSNNKKNIEAAKSKMKNASSGGNKKNQNEVDDESWYNPTHIISPTPPVCTKKSISSIPSSPRLSNTATATVTNPVGSTTTASSVFHSLHSEVPHFFRHKDPELDAKQQLKAKFGDGKNLVAIGPPKVRGSSWLSKDQQSPVFHDSPFSFGFI